MKSLFFTLLFLSLSSFAQNERPCGQLSLKISGGGIAQNAISGCEAGVAYAEMTVSRTVNGATASVKVDSRNSGDARSTVEARIREFILGDNDLGKPFRRLVLNELKTAINGETEEIRQEALQNAEKNLTEILSK